MDIPAFPAGLWAKTKMRRAELLPPRWRRWLAAGGMSALICTHAHAGEIKAGDMAGFRQAAASAKPGTTILLEGGSYKGGAHLRGLKGEEGRPIIIAAADLENPPVFQESGTGLHLVSPAFVELRGLSFAKLAHNGLNIDDTGGEPAHHVVLRGLRIREVGEKGNEDAIKLSGVQDFQVTDCTVERWGSGGGSGVDMVGCHRGLIEKSVFRDVAEGASNGVQCKGGSTSITIRGNRFENAGARSVNIGGSTGRAFFRPPIKPEGGNAEARDVTVEGNVFVGSMAPAAFVGVDGAVVRFNTFEKPGRWALRILQENQAKDFVPCRNGAFTDNVIVFSSGQWASGGVNIGGGTEPETFTFARNWWLCEDDPGRSQPRLPVAETDGVYGRPVEEARGKAGSEAWAAKNRPEVK